MTFHFQVNALAIVLAVLSSFLLGFVWYSFLFNKSWKKELNLYTDARPTTSQMIRSLGLNLLGTILMVWFFTQMQFNSNRAIYVTALFIWIGFYLPQDMNKISFQNRSTKLFAIDTGFNLASLMVTAFILSLFK